jgi:hypothetical protein
MKAMPARIRGTHHHSFRSGEWADIIGVRMAFLEIAPPRPCFLVQFEDGKTDLIAICDSANYEIGFRQ